MTMTKINIMQRMMMIMIMFQTVIQGYDDENIDFVENDDGYDNVLDRDPR